MLCDNQELMSQWNYVKNKDLDPSLFTHGSSKKVWWVCSKGHEWEATIANRSYGYNCPYCAGQKVLIGYNDLSTTEPELSKQWHPYKNENITPEQVTRGCGKKAWWLCSKGHEWEAVINSRANGMGCPICSNKKLLTGYNDLATTNPELVKEWHPTKNKNISYNEVMRGSAKKVWWQCRKGHEWQATIGHRSAGEKCPICMQESHTSFPEQAIYFYINKVIRAENRNIAFGKEIDIYIPELRCGIEYNGFWHKNKKQADKKKKEYFNSLGIRIIVVQEGKENKVNNDNIIYIPSSSNRESLEWVILKLFEILKFTSCDINIAEDEQKIYEQYLFLEKNNSLELKYPDIALEWNYQKNGKLKPDVVSFGSDKKVWWVCSKGHEWQATIANRTFGYGCPVCSGRVALTGYNDLATLNPQISREWHYEKNNGLKPENFTIKSGKKVWWQCEKGHEWETAICNRTGGKTNCPYCSGQKVLKGYNDLATLNPELAKEWNVNKNLPLTAEDVTLQSNKKVWWVCSKGHEWETTVFHRYEGTGCPICTNRIIKTGYNDLATTNPELVKEWNYDKNLLINPTKVSRGSGKKVWWKCKNSHEWQATILSRSSGTNCPFCYKENRTTKK